MGRRIGDDDGPHAGGSGGGRPAGTVGGRREGAAGRRGACARPWLISRVAAGSGLRAADLVSVAAAANDEARARRSSRSSLPVSARDVARACEGGPRAAARCEEAGSGGREKRITPFDRRLLLRFDCDGGSDSRRGRSAVKRESSRRNGNRQIRMCYVEGLNDVGFSSDA